MFHMGFSGNEGDTHIRYDRIGQHPGMLLFFQMGEYQTLPVFVQFVLTAIRPQYQAAARLPRFQQQMHLPVWYLFSVTGWNCRRTVTHIRC